MQKLPRLRSFWTTKISKMWQVLTVFNQIWLLIEGSNKSSDYCDHHLSHFFLDSKGPQTCSFCLKVWVKQVNYLIEDDISSSQNPSPKDDKFRCQTSIFAWDNGLWTTTSQNFIRRKGKLLKFILEKLWPFTIFLSVCFKFWE